MPRAIVPHRGAHAHANFGNLHWVPSARLSPDGQQAFTGSHDRTAKLWCADPGECLRAFQGHGELVFFCRVLPPVASGRSLGRTTGRRSCGVLTLATTCAPLKATVGR